MKICKGQAARTKHEEDLVETEAGGMGHEEGRSCVSRWSSRWRGT